MVTVDGWTSEEGEEEIFMSISFLLFEVLLLLELLFSEEFSWFVEVLLEV